MREFKRVDERGQQDGKKSGKLKAIKKKIEERKIDVRIRRGGREE